MIIKATISGPSLAVEKVINLLRAAYIVDDPYEPKIPPRPTDYVSRTVTVEVPTGSQSPNSALRLVDTRAKYATEPEAA